MKNESDSKTRPDDRLGCIGDFNILDPVCKKFCALRLRCLIERDQNNSMELLEDLMFSDCALTKIQ